MSTGLSRVAALSNPSMRRRGGSILVRKMVYWLSSVAAGTAVSASGFLLLFPFYGTNIADMQLALVAHAIIAVLFIALILAHIYIGTLEVEGAFEVIGMGEVDLN